MDAVRGVDALQNEIEKSKDKLKGYNENIKKLTGRDPSRPGVRRMLSEEGQGDHGSYQNRMSRGRGRLFGLARRSIMDDTGPPSKRRAVGGAFSRLGPAPVMRRRDREDSPYEEEPPQKLSVQSSVTATSREAKNRDEIMQEQTKDKEGMQRNRRMFGLLLGTLNRFKTESKTLETKDVRRKKIEEKLEQKAEKERQKVKQETKLLMEEMHIEQTKISRLEQKMEMVQEHADREAEIMKLKNFIVTKAKPRIFWKPVQMNSTADSKMKDSKKIVDDMLREGKDRLDKEIVELMERENKREERIKMRLREDGLLGGDDESGDNDNNENVDDNNEDDSKGNGDRDVSDNISNRLGPMVKTEIEEDEGEEDLKKKKSRRTVVIENEEPEDSGGEQNGDDGTVEEDEEEVEGKENSGTGERVVALVNESEGETEGDNSRLITMVEEGDNSGDDNSDKNSDSDDDESNAPAVDEQVVRERKKSGDRKEKENSKRDEGSSRRDEESSQRDEGRKDKGDDRKIRESDKSRKQKDEKRSRHRDGSEEKSRDRVKSRSKSRDRGGDKKRHRRDDDEDRKKSKRGSEKESRDDRKDRKRDKERSRHSKKSDSESGDDSHRPVVIKKEKDVEKRVGAGGKKRRKTSRSDSDDDGVVIKKERSGSRK